MSSRIVLPSIKSVKKETKVYPTTDFTLYFDGCSKGNPGHSGIGAVIYKHGVECWFSCKYVGNHVTNNEAEYLALILGLENALKKNITSLSVCGDSMLIINQVNGIYQVKHPKLIALHDRATALAQQFDYVEFNHVYRADNKRADQLCNIALTAGANDADGCGGIF